MSPNPVNPSLPRKSAPSEFLGAIWIIAGSLLFLALLSFQMQISEGQEPIANQNLIGSLGHYLAQLLLLSFGKPAFLLGPYLLILGVLTISRSGFSDPLSRISGGLVMLLGASILVATMYAQAGHPSQVIGGLIGARFANILYDMVGGYGTGIISIGILLGGLSLSIRIPLSLFFQQAQLLLRKLIQYYIEIFSGQRILPKIPTPQASATPTPPQQNDSFIQKENATQRPWIERIEKTENTYHTTHTPEMNSQETDDKAKRSEGTFKFSKLSERTRRLQERLKQINKRHNAGAKKVVADKQDTHSFPWFEGHFDNTETRFHFHTPPPLTIPKPDTSTFVSGDWEKNFVSLEASNDLPSQTKNTSEKFYADIPINPSPYSKPNLNSTTPSKIKPTLYNKHLSTPEENEFTIQKEETTYVSPTTPSVSPTTPSLSPTTSSLSPTTPSLSNNAKFISIEEVETKEIEDIHSIIAQKETSSKVPDWKQNSNEYQIDTQILHSLPPTPQVDIHSETNKVREKLEKVMQEYGIQTQVVAIQRGPILTLYELKLEPGIKVSRVLNLQNEICMNLAVPIVRIIAPIPGKSTIGIEVPNSVREPVMFSQLLPAPAGALNIVLGKNISGENIYADLTRLPHLLIAGATGAGKSVYMNSVIASLLYNNSPSDTRFIMIDPKMVELKLYEGIPHLLMPVITDVYEASKALRWLLDEMERRYRLLSLLRCRDISSYNERKAKQNEQQREGEKDNNKMPYIIVLIDELSDLMMIAAKDVEDSIIRLTQKARAIGIHIIMATQRPSVDVITALIKANCPARVAFQVAQRTDSRTILDANGAENLLGKGDLLYKSPQTTTLTRIQAPLLSEEEVESIVKQTKRFGEAVYVDLSDNDEEGNNDADANNHIDETLFEQALEIVLETGKTSTSYIQRRMRIGYNRAANLIEAMEQRGHLSPSLGNKPREILHNNLQKAG